MSTKKKQTAMNGESVVARSKKRNPKLFSLWSNVDNNRKEVNENKKFVRPGGDKGGRVLGLKIISRGNESNWNSSAAPANISNLKKKTTFTPQILHIGKKSNKIHEDFNTSISGEKLCISMVFKKGITDVFNVGNNNLPIPANFNLTPIVDIIYHNPGFHWKVGDKFGLDKTNIINGDGNANEAYLLFEVTKTNKPKK